MTSTAPAGRVLPGDQWVTALSANPVGAINDLIEGVFPFEGPVDPDAAQLLWAWLRPSGPHHDHVARVDDALATWVEGRWARLSHGDYSSVQFEATVWSDALRAAALLRAVPSTSAVIARLFPERSLLGSISLGPALDPLADLLRAAALTQRDDAFVEEWWALCDLRDFEPPHRGEVGILGMRHLARPSAMQGLFHEEIVWALCRFGAALSQLEPDGRPSGLTGREHFILLARRLRAEYPFPERWREYASRATSFVKLPENWLAPALGIARERTTDESASQGRTTTGFRNPTWAGRSQSIRRDLLAGRAEAIERAQALLDEQRAHAVATGDTWPIVASACSFAGGVRQRDPQRALGWAHDAIEWNPDDHYGWTEATSALLMAEGPFATLPLAWLTSERFPWESAPLNLLAHVLMRSRQLDLAEAVYRASRARFPEDPHSIGGLAEVLKHRRELDEAEGLYRAGISRFPDNGVLMCGLAAVLRLVGPARWNEAAQVLHEASALPNSGSSVRRELKRLEMARAAAELGSSSTDADSDWDIDVVSEEEAERWTPDAMTAARAARSIRLMHRILGTAPAELAWRYIEQAKVGAASPAAGRVDAEEALLTLDVGNVDGASAIAERAAQRRPGAVAVAYAQASTRRAQATLRSTPFSGDALSALSEPWRRLSLVKAVPAGLALVGDMRAAAALTDGQIADDALAVRWDRLRNWITNHESRGAASVSAAFAQRLRMTAPLPSLLRSVVSAEDLRRSVNLESAGLDELEESTVFSSG